jgi:hypothetical protein
VNVALSRPDKGARKRRSAWSVAGVTHIVLAAILGGRPVRWLADEIIEPVLAQARRR